MVGCGRVGMTAAYAMLLSGTPTEIVLFDRNKDKAQGEKMDLEQALSLLPAYVKITATDNFADLAGVKLIIYTAGVAQAPGQTRLDLVNTNRRILEEILPKINQAAPESVILMVANPVDVLTYWANEIVDTSPPSSNGRIFGSGTMLDTARFRFHLSEILTVNPHSIHAYILGEHGETSFPVYANTSIGGQNMLDLPNITKEVIDLAYQQTREAAKKIIEAKGATYYAIGVVVMKIMQAIASDSKTVYPLSVPLTEYQGYTGVALSVPCVLGASGVEKILDVDLSASEKEAFDRSVAALIPFCKG